MIIYLRNAESEFEDLLKLFFNHVLDPFYQNKNIPNNITA